ncbi:DUF4296 domain-containing protein [Sunxiuqinia sp. A32]|uniref:DUF4296 domain-containing protein n=1 Tax=Sunxiuqinia sp. A32 TaxID=3461496 RepID=UPI0040458D48
MRPRILVIVSIVVLIGYSCNETGYPKPDNLVSEKQMIDMLYDIHMNEAYLGNHRYDIDSLRFTSVDLHYSVLDKYGVADSTFYQSVLYYSSLPKTYDKIYQEVVNRMVMLEQEINKKEAVKVLKE